MPWWLILHTCFFELKYTMHPWILHADLFIRGHFTWASVVAVSCYSGLVSLVRRVTHENACLYTLQYISRWYFYLVTIGCLYTLQYILKHFTLIFLSCYIGLHLVTFGCILLQWARQLGKKSDPRVRVPLHSCEHFYLVTKPLDGISPFMPGNSTKSSISQFMGDFMPGILCPC